MQPYGLQQARLLCPQQSPRVCSNSCQLSRWCYLTIASSAAFFSCLQSFLESWSFPVSQLFSLGGQSIGASASVPVLPMNTQGWFPLGLTFDLLVVQETLKSLPQHISSKALILQCLTCFMVQVSHLYIVTGKTILWLYHPNIPRKLEQREAIPIAFCGSISKKGLQT